MTLLILKFILLAATIVIAGTYLTNYADVIAEISGMGRTLAGLVLLAAATSLPELAVDCAAAMIPAPDLAVGALVGSSLFNLLILGMLDLFQRGDRRILSPTSAHHAISAITTIILTAIVVLFVVLKEFSLTFLGVGLGPALILLVYIGSLRLIYLDQRGRGTDDSLETPHLSLPKAVIGYVVCTLVIFVAAHYLAPTADAIAHRSGLGGTFIGSTFVALTTSLPEVVTTTAAVRLGSFDMAVGNVLGSNAFNMAILFPVDIFYRQGSILQDAELANAMTGTAVIVLTGVATLALLYRPKKRYWLIEPDAALVVLIGLSTLLALYYLTPAAELAGK